MDNFDRFPARRFFDNVATTSGTTGHTGRFYRDIQSIAAEDAFQSRYFGWDGKPRLVIRGEKFLDVNQHPARIYVKIPFFQHIVASSLHLRDEALADLCHELANIENVFLWAFPSTAAILAEYCLRKKVHLHIVGIGLSSEMLVDYQVELLHKWKRKKTDNLESASSPTIIFQAPTMRFWSTLSNTRCLCN